jgi:uncharacterized protein (TIGR03905 family)
MIYTFSPRGVCAQEMRVEVDDQGVIQNMQVLGGCSGNLQGISALVRGMSAQEAIQRLKGIRCGFKDTSCPDQFARNLEKAMAEQK